MGRYLVAFVVLLGFQAVSAVGSTCKDANPFIKSLVAERKIVVVDDPVDSKSHCATEWQEFGTCCTEESAVRYAKIDKDLLKTATEIVIDSLKTQEMLTRKILQDLKSWISSDPNLNKSSEISSSVVNIQQSLQEVQNITASTHEDCWTREMVQIRSASICSTCSGRSLIFFFEDQAIVSFDTCKEMLNKCSPSIDQIITMMGLAETIYNLMLSMQTNDSLEASFDDSKIITLNHLFSVIDKQRVATQLKQYSKANEGSESKALLVGPLCRHFMRLHGDPFIIEITKVINLHEIKV